MRKRLSIKKNFGSICERICAEKKDRFEKINLYCQDESRFGLHTHTGKMLTAKGIKPIAVSQQVFKSAWLAGAFSPIDGKHLLMEADNCNSDFFQVFINELSATNTDELMLILLDNTIYILNLVYKNIIKISIKTNIHI